VTALALLLAAAAPAMADALLEQLAGEWIGKGTGVRRPGAPSESIYCRIANEIVEDGAVLEQSGRCALGNDTGTLSGQIRSLGGGRYDGTMTSPVMRGAAAIAGTGGGRRLELKAVYEDSKTGRPTRSVVSLRVIADGQYRMVTQASDAATGEPVQSSELLFRRQ
jgi:hypothetical protein